MGGWKFLLLEVIVIAVTALATHYLIQPSSAHAVQSTTSTATTTVQAGYPYLTSSELNGIFGNRPDSTYSANYCSPGNSTDSALCSNVAFFGPRGTFVGWVVGYSSNGIKLDEIVLPNASPVAYDTMVSTLYPNSTKGYLPNSLIINATMNGASYSVQFGDSYTNIYAIKGNTSAFVYITGSDYTQNYTQMLIENVSKNI